MENEILRGRPVGSVTNGGYGKPNGLTPEQTIGFINKQSANDAEWKAVKAFYNGSWNMLERGVLGSLAMLRDNNIESLKAQGIDVGDGGNLTRADVHFDDYRSLLSLLHREDERGERRQQGGRLQRLGTADAENVRPDAIVGIWLIHLRFV